jgi:lipopolysaccharide biosynthesis protein
MLLWISLIICVLVLVLTYILHRPREKFTTKPRNINVACLYAAHNITAEDVAFILKYSNDIPFYIINNGDLSRHAEQLINKPNIKITARENNGYDAGAWKFGMKHYKEYLNKYEMIIFMNNSCIFGVDLLRLCEHAIDYDLYSYGFSYELYRKPYATPHLHAYLFFVNKRLYKSPDFANHWDNIDENSCDHDESCNRNEYRLKSFFESRGYKVGSYIFFDVEDTYKYTEKDRYSNEIIKKRELKAYPEKINDFNAGLNNNHRQGY